MLVQTLKFMKIFTTKENKKLTEKYWLLTLEGEIKKPSPGQFVMVRAWPGFDPLLSRPFSIHYYEPGRLSILYEVKGRGTKLLAKLGPGKKVEILGPLGQGFPEVSSRDIILVAGGIGIAPFLFTAKEFIRKGHQVHLFYGARTQNDFLCLKEFEALGVSLTLTTEDGSLGTKGFITQPLKAYLSKHKKGVIFACGPMPMLSAVAQVTKESGIKAFVSLEAHMACGLGLCLGCVVKHKEQGYLHVCSEGPVVPAENVF
ncbi:oxidoreductase FAD/NAD(P)-binding domain protein [Thermodesulfatator indicus DSM 15286]|uniref:Dihydroorotate dehydrogenase B (NAD(+)), electron transfer subunit n=2 Tax=Thermodesulfatator indicus TaxID=171695 RepID=F8ADA2_THEID|nr:oxidoreductase FAD/NAD(P)-binding domain protein [Thermodesulfatator indicus DSM 15286]